MWYLYWKMWSGIGYSTFTLNLHSDIILPVLDIHSFAYHRCYVKSAIYILIRYHRWPWSRFLWSIQANIGMIFEMGQDNCRLAYLLYGAVLLENLTSSHLVKKFPVFYGTRRFVAPFTCARHLPLSGVSLIQSILPTSHFLKIHLNIILPPTPGPSENSLSLRLHHQNPVYTFPLPHTYYLFRPSHYL